MRRRAAATPAGHRAPADSPALAWGVWLTGSLVLAGCATRPPADVPQPASPPAATPRPATPAEVPPPAPPAEPAPRSAALGRLAADRPGRLAVGSVLAVDADTAGSRLAAAMRVALATDLRAISVLDAEAPTRLDAVVGRRNGVADAQITLTRGGQTRLKKRYRVEWPAAADEASVVRSLLGDVYDDPEFGLAIKE